MRALRDNAPVLIIAALTVLSFFAILFFASSEEKKNSTSLEVDPSKLVAEGTYLRGEASASATLVEFSDFECPACGAFYPILKSLEAKYSGKLKVAFKHFPLAQHPNAYKAAEAAEAAGEQGKFWEMHDKLFENQENLTVEAIKGYAKELGLDEGKFADSLDGGKFSQKVKKDLDLGNELGVNATPTFYLNGKKLNLKTASDLEDELSKVLNSN